MVHVSRTFTVECPAERARSYLADFSNAPEWDPGTVSCERVGDRGAPVAVGARWRNVSKLLVITTELDYELVEDTAERIRLVGRNKTATSTDTVSIRALSAASTELTYDSRVQFNGWAKVSDPLMTLLFHYLAGKTVSGITAALQRPTAS
ncbi:SRPBCC family protein [Nakamurella aerolata]|uniref:Polyketide cyclase n=1 Tax=Nakamurella aerolata TaxID=1656892 RepID=A0A849A5S0_9ACTN|nr:SRPBCC family protein [Nakamurella aerolata]NNG36334.1 polyketide cyclase [Nakamurella aerolata]